MTKRTSQISSKKKTSQKILKSNESKPELQVVGWREWVSLPQIGVKKIKAKLDTGARSSALHAFNLLPIQKNGKRYVQFDVHPIQQNNKTRKTCTCEVVDYRWVTNSGGGQEKRFVIVTELFMGGDRWPIEVTLTDRDQMGFRMLIGRTAMEHRLMVDPSASYRLEKPHTPKRTSQVLQVLVPQQKKEEEE